MDVVDCIGRPARRFKLLCEVPPDLDAVTSIGVEASPPDVDVPPAAIQRVWEATRRLYQTGLYPALQICIRRRGEVVLNRALGHARGNAPGALPSTTRVPVTTETPFCIYSASKAITAMLIHHLDDRGVLHVHDRICEYLPEFRQPGKDQITLAHVLSHRAGIPNVPPGALELDLLERPSEIVSILAREPLTLRPGRRLAYHAVTGGFVLGEIVRRATGQDIRSVLRKEILEPLGFRWMNYGVARSDLGRVGQDAVTGIPPMPPFSQLFHRALGVPFDEVVRWSQDPRFMSGIVPAANVVSNAFELCAFYQCLLDGGELDGVHVLAPRTIRRATVEQSYMEVDLTLGFPGRHGLGLFLGASVLSPYGPDTNDAFGHVGFTNIFSWADPRRDIAVAIITSGKPFLSIETARLYWLLVQIGRQFSKVQR